MTYTAPSLVLDVSRASDRVLLTITGEIDLASAPQLRDVALEALRGSPGALHLDMSAVTFMDSIGLHVLLATKRRADLAGVRLLLIEPSRAVTRLLQVTGLSGAFLQEAAAEPDRTAG